MAHVINGTNNGETINGTDANDTIYAKGGDDTVIDDKGNDWIYGGDGNDVLTGGRGTNDYWGDAGNDVVKVVARGAFSDDLVHGFTQGQDKIDVSAWGITDFTQVQDLLYTDNHGDATFNAYYNGFDHVMRIADIDIADLTAADFTFAVGGPKNQTGTANDDVLFGTTGDNVLNGGDGNDTLMGGDGNDTLIGGPGLDDYDGGNGRDTLSYAYSADEGVHVNLKKGFAEFSDGAREFILSVENVIGSQVGDLLTGDNGNNRLDGQAGNDTLEGGGGKDKLIGGAGADMLTGGGGKDIFIFNAISDSAANNRDGITDFSTGDRIDLTGLEDSSNQALHYIGNAAYSHTAGELQVITTGSISSVNVDINGDGTTDFSISVTGSHAPGSGDFLL
jgi:Ca2+-binding RTX toxin-like protein